MSAISGRLPAAFFLRGSALRRLFDARRLPLAHTSSSPRRPAPLWCAEWSPIRWATPSAALAFNSSKGKKAVAVGIADADGAYEIRSTEAGRFILLTSSAQFFPGISADFYGGSTDADHAEYRARSSLGARGCHGDGDRPAHARGADQFGGHADSRSAIWRRRSALSTRCASLPAWMWCRPGRRAA